MAAPVDETFARWQRAALDSIELLRVSEALMEERAQLNRANVQVFTDFVRLADTFCVLVESWSVSPEHSPPRRLPPEAGGPRAEAHGE